MIHFTGKNPEFTATFDVSTQSYTVYKSGRMLVKNKFKFSDIQSYLN